MEIEVIVTEDSGKRFRGTVTLQPEGASKPRSQHATQASPTKTERNSLPAEIIRLRDSGFFSQPRTAQEVHKALQGKYHCELNRVVMALIRLQRRKELRKASREAEGRLQVAYAW